MTNSALRETLTTTTVAPLTSANVQTHPTNAVPIRDMFAVPSTSTIENPNEVNDRDERYDYLD